MTTESGAAADLSVTPPGPAPAAPPPHSNSELAEARASWIKAGLDTWIGQGKDAAQFDQAGHAARFDQAARADGMNPIEPVSADIVKLYADFGLPAAPKPEDYRLSWGEFGRNTEPHRLVQIEAETTEWAAAVGFNATMGAGIIQRIAEIGPRVQAMTADARTEWMAQQEAAAIKVFGSEEAVKEMRGRALAVLDRAKDNAFSKSLANSTALNDVMLLTTLANHSRTLEAFAAAHPQMARAS